MQEQTGNPDRVVLVEQLRLENIDPKKLCDDWFTVSGDDWSSKERDFVQLLYHSIGWFSFRYHFRHGAVVKYLTRQRAETDNPAMEAVYLTNYDEFLEHLFYSYNFSESSGGVQFVTSVGSAVQLMMRGTYDSYRVIAARTGMKIMASCFLMLGKISEDSVVRRDSLESASSNSNLPTQVSKNKITKIIETLIKQFFPRAIRDVCQEVRAIVYDGMLKWSDMNPAILLDSQWHRYITFGLADDRKLYMLSVVRNLFRDNIDVSKQRELLKTVQMPLTHHVAKSGKASCISMEILSSAARFLNVTDILPSDVLDVIYTQVFHPEKTKAVCAANFLFHTKFNGSASNPTRFLSGLVVLNSESTDLMAISSEELLIDSFYSIMKQFVTWEHWLEFLNSSPPQYILGCAKLFINYARKITTNYCPRTRSLALNRLPAKDLISAKDSFTIFLSTHFHNILGIDQILNNSEALSLIIRSMTFFSKIISSKVAMEIVSQLSLMIRSQTSLGVVASCWSSLKHLKTIITLDITEKTKFCSLWDTLRSHVIQEFMDYSDDSSSQHNVLLVELRTLGLIKCGESNDRVWDSFCAKLQWLIDDNPRGAMIPVVLRVLCNVVFHQYKLIDESTQNHGEDEDDDSQNLSRTTLSGEEPPENIPTLVRRFSVLQNFAILLIGKQFASHLRVVAFKVLARGLECFGKHMVSHPVFTVVSGIVDVRVESLLVEFACEAMERNPNEEPVELGFRCCDVLKTISPIFGSNYINIYKLCGLLALITPLRSQGASHVDRHGVEVMSALTLYMNNFPNSGGDVAVIIFKTLFMLMKDNADTQDFDIMVIVSYWKRFVDFEKIISIPYIHQGLEKLFDYMFNLTGLETFNALSRSMMSRALLESGTGVSLGRSTVDVTFSADRRSPRDSGLNYSAFQANSAPIGHSTFQEPSIPLSETSDLSTP